MTAGTPLASEYKEENLKLVEDGVCNLQKHIENTAQYGIPVLVAINKFASDTAAELDIIRKASLEAGLHIFVSKLLHLSRCAWLRVIEAIPSLVSAAQVCSLQPPPVDLLSRAIHSGCPQRHSHAPLDCHMQLLEASLCTALSQLADES